ncbi:MAG TPA: zf-HC2 domain-containing protein [Myxococcota bacterium]|nr:zf-HC2 domain-containing protein [Myxococcota bacterium]
MSPEDRIPFEDDLSAYLDGELDAARAAELRAALERDPRLAARLEALRAVDARLRATPAPPVPGDLRARLQARIDAARARPEPAPARPTRGRGAAPARRRRWRAAPAVAAAAVAAAIALVMLGRRPPDDLPPQRVAEGAPSPAPDAPAVDLAAASDEELEIAMDWRLVDEDLEMIEELELLEAMLARDRGQG